METQKLTFQRQETSRIILGHDILKEVVGQLARLQRSESPTQKSSSANVSKTCLVLTNEVVAKWYLQPLLAELRARGFKAEHIVLPDGESQKTLETVSQLLTRILELPIDRHSPMITLGGGVIGDIGGFIAAIYRRGMPLVQLPTTLLAMVDASVGGKVGVNAPTGKNQIGTFYQPTLVGIDISTLQTLPLSQLSYGLVEALKHGAIADPAYYRFILKNIDTIKAKDLSLLQRLVRRSIHLKKSFVEEDELDHGKRMHLNFGHTFGHALETLGEYRRLHHGEAVGLGMLMALAAAKKFQILEEDYTESLTVFLRDLTLPVSIPKEWPASEIVTAMLRDKKIRGNSIKLVLPTRLGNVKLENHSTDELITLLEPLCGKLPPITQETT